MTTGASLPLRHALLTFARSSGIMENTDEALPTLGNVVELPRPGEAANN